jgi:hypothetical protein
MDSIDPSAPDLDAYEDLDGGPYTGSREARDGSIHLWDDEEHLIALPAGFPVEHLPAIGRAIHSSYERGRIAGQWDKAYEIRRSLML